jgi:hypothetical protein
MQINTLGQSNTMNHWARSGPDIHSSEAELAQLVEGVDVCPDNLGSSPLVKANLDAYFFFLIKCHLVPPSFF